MDLSVAGRQLLGYRRGGDGDDRRVEKVHEGSV